MDKSPKRSFLEVYSSEEKEIADVDSLQKEFERFVRENTSNTNTSSIFDDKIGIMYNDIQPCIFFIIKSLLFFRRYL
jgi:hypothetical protein